MKMYLTRTNELIIVPQFDGAMMAEACQWCEHEIGVVSARPEQ
jgi:hypothetical protein